MRDLPMFPLSAPLLPGMVLPLRLFEPRYLQLYADVIDSTREFGVILIERGTETGDRSKTFDIGCTADIVGSGMNHDGTIGVMTIGRQRIEIDEWLVPNPYPRARIVDLEDPPLSERGLRWLGEASERLPELLETAARLNPQIETDIPLLTDDPVLALYEVAQLAGLQALDLQMVLETREIDSRARLVKEKLDETIELIRLQIEIGDR